MSTDTPRTDDQSVRYYDDATGKRIEYVPSRFARQLERELASAQAEKEKWEQIACDKLIEVCMQIEEKKIVTEQRDRLAKACDQYSEDEILCKLQEITEQRDRLAVVVQGIRSGFGGQIPDPTCDCGDCEFLIKIDNALQYITKQNDNEHCHTDNV
jgi:acyl-CoA reductase-like NAD-dependent aldehyde dehydrogenase